MPETGGNLNTDLTTWGKVPKNPSIIYSFNEQDAARANQDVGFDGLSDAEEFSKYSATITNFSKLNPNDPASDNFQFFRGSELDAANASIITRYKNYNNTEGN